LQHIVAQQYHMKIYGCIFLLDTIVNAHKLLFLPSKVKTMVLFQESAPTLQSLTNDSIVLPMSGKQLTIVVTRLLTLQQRNLFAAIVLASNL